MHADLHIKLLVWVIPYAVALYWCLEILSEQKFFTEAFFPSLLMTFFSTSYKTACSFLIQLYYIRGILEGFFTFCWQWIYLMSHRPHPSVWHTGVTVQGRTYNDYWNVLASLWASQVMANPTTSIPPVGVESSSIPWTFHTSGTRAYIPMFWIYISRLVGSAANWEIFDI